MRFRITWHSPESNGSEYEGYKVSIPQYDGGEVVTLDEVEDIEEDAKAAARGHELQVAHMMRSLRNIERLLKLRDRQLKQTMQRLIAAKIGKPDA